MVTTAVEKIDDTKVKLSITVEADRVTKAIDDAARKLAGSMKIPGFRPGKAPLKVIESRLGKEAVMEEAARDTFPAIYSEALAEAEITPVGQPRLEVEEFTRGADGLLNATVDVRPTFDVPSYAGMTIEHPEWEVTDEEIDAQLDEMRERFAEVEAVERPVQQGDHVTITLTAKQPDGTVVDEASAEDVLYEVPTEETDSELDRQVIGAEAGSIVTFTDTLGPDYPEELAGQELEFTVIVKEVKTKSLPELDDDFALTASEFDTIDELIADLREQMGAEKLQMARGNLRGTVVERIAEQVDIPLPESLVEEEQRFRLNRIAQQAEQNGIDFEQFLNLVGGGDPQALIDHIKAEAEQTVKAQLVVDEIGQAAGIEVEQEDLGHEVTRQAMRMGRDPQEVAQLMTQPDRIGALYADAYRRKTIDHLLESVDITNVPPDPEPEPEVEVEESDAALEESEVEESDTPEESDEA